MQVDSSTMRTSGIKVTLYTHPLCKISWSMQQDWARFYQEYRGSVAFYFCIDGITLATPGLGKASNTSQMCMAVKAASLQSEHAAYLYLTALARAIWEEGNEAPGLDLLVGIARKVNAEHRDEFNLGRFGNDFSSRQASKALNQDLRKVHINRVVMSPTITLTSKGIGVKLEGYHNYADLVKAMARVATFPETYPVGNIC